MIGSTCIVHPCRKWELVSLVTGLPEVHEEQGLQRLRGQVCQRLCQLSQGRFTDGSPISGYHALIFTLATITAILKMLSWYLKYLKSNTKSKTYLNLSAKNPLRCFPFGPSARNAVRSTWAGTKRRPRCGWISSVKKPDILGESNWETLRMYMYSIWLYM